MFNKLSHKAPGGDVPPISASKALPGGGDLGPLPKKKGAAPCPWTGSACSPECPVFVIIDEEKKIGACSVRILAEEAAQRLLEREDK